MKKEKRELSIEFNGKTYKGYRIIKWADSGNMNQLIHYKMFYTRKDLCNYKPGQEKMMENVARMIMEDLVREAGGRRMG